MKVYNFTYFVLLLWPFVLLGQNGLDQSFGANGKQAFFLNEPTNNFVHRISQAHPDSLNRITLISTLFSDASSKILINRRLENGATDTLFGQNGFINIPLNDSNSFYYHLSAIDPQGRIVFAGITDGIFPDIVVSRYLPNGQLDLSFAGLGHARFEWSPWADYVISLLVQTDGKIMLSGTVNAGGNADFAAMRLLPNGNPDSSFNGNGLQFVHVVMQDQNAIINVLDNGKYLLAGAYLSMDSAGLALTQLNQNGTLDTLFGNKGSITWTYGRGDHYFASLQSIPGGKFLGIIKRPGEGDTYRIVRFLANGSIDASFGSNGSNAHLINPIQVIPDSNTGYFIAYNNRIKRYHNSGMLDTSFGNQNIGFPEYDFSVHCDTAFLDFFIRMPDKNFRAFGGKALGNQEGHYGIAIVSAFTKAGKYLYAFADSGVLKWQMERTNVIVPLRILSTKSLSNGKIVLAALARFNYYPTLILFQLNAKGNLDTLFASGGLYKIALNNTENLHAALVQMSNGDICFSYLNRNIMGDSMTILQLDQNGILHTITSFLFGMDPVKKLILVEHQNKILISGHGVIRFNRNGMVDLTFNPIIDIVPEMLFVNRKQQVLIGYDSAVRCVESDGLLNTQFGKNGEITFSYPYLCNGNSFKSYLTVSQILEDTVQGNYIVSGSIQRSCPGNYRESVGFTCNSSGKNIDTIPSYSLSHFSGKPQQIKMLKNSYLVHDYWTPQTGHPALQKGVVMKVNFAGEKDLTFGTQGKILAQEGMYKLTDSSAYLNYSSIEQLDDNHCWWIQNYRDTVYVNKLVVQDPKLVLDFSADTTMFNSPTTARFQVQTNYPVKSYLWNIQASVGGEYSYSLGTDSSFASPAVYFSKPGIYDIQLGLQLADTLIQLNKNSYINYLSTGLNYSTILDQGLEIFPNPSNGNVFLKSDQDLSGSILQIYSMQGNLLQRFTLDSTPLQSINLPQNQGLYVLRLTTVNGQYVSKIIQRN